MKLQVTLDTYSIDDGIALVRGVADYLDVIEVGTPLLFETGMSAIDRIREAFPTVNIMACWDAIKDEIFLIILIIVIPTVLTFGVSGLVTQWFIRRRKGGKDHD